MLRALFARVRVAVLSVPNTRAWIECAVLTGFVAAIYLGVGLSTGLIHFTPRSAPEIAQIALVAFFVPALGEEIVFRGLMIPGRDEAGRALTAIAGSTVLFTAWHVAESAYLPGVAQLFRRLDFLALAALLGLTSALLRRRSGSIWPAVALHWIVVVGWLGWFGGPTISEL